MFLTRFAFATVVASCGLIGLSTSPVKAADGKVTGKVEVGNQPLASGRVIFHLDNGQFVGSNVKNGGYTIDRVPVGIRKVTVEGEGVPNRYAGEETSPLRVKIVEGTTSYNFSL